MNRRGFTLIELLVVIAILMILGGMLLTALNSARTRSKTHTTQATLTLLKAQLIRYEDDYGDFPPSEGDGTGMVGAESLLQCLMSDKKNGPYVKTDDVRTCDSNNNRDLEIADDWSRPIRYIHHRDYGSRPPRKREYRLISAGPNGVFEDGAKGSDDIVNWDIQNPDK